MLKLTITRHGETEENKTGIFQGHLPGTLSALGIKQAEKLAERLTREQFDYIYSSDLARAADTTKIILQSLRNIPVSYTTKLREIDFGALQGHTKSDLKDLVCDPETFTEGMPDGESFADFEQRARDFLQFLQDNHDGQSVLLVCHQNIAKALITLITGKDLNEMNKMGNLTNASISQFDLHVDDTAQMTLYNCHQHLEDLE
jgi:probable phosphoglycerate mutase